uniref:Uncharacterized protein n=1 Tax=Panagrolaimus superbus TaxID=310955 RepID=A0A914YDG5_9BILA
MATELVEKLNRDEECVPGDCKRARIGAFKQLAKVMLVDDEEFDPNEDLRRWNFQKLPVCTTDSCWRPSHYGVTRKIHILKDGRKFTPRYDAIMNPKGIEKVTDKDAEPLATYFQRSFGVSLDILVIVLSFF